MARAAKIVGLLSLLAVPVAQAQPRVPDTTLVYARVDTLELKLDLYLPDSVAVASAFPASAAPVASESSLMRTFASFFRTGPTASVAPLRRPLIVWIHGGGWRGGSRSEIPSALPLLEAGYAVASIDYRFSMQAPWPAPLHDAKAAVRWLRAHGDSLGLDTARIVAWGNSAGGHLAALVGLIGPSDGLEGAVGNDSGASSAVRAVVDYFGPTDFLEPHARRWKRGSSVGQLLGCAVPDCPLVARRASPVAYVSMGDPPFFILHGSADSTVPSSQSMRLVAALRNAGVPAEFTLVAGADHGGRGFESAEMMARVRAFLDSVLFGMARAPESAPAPTPADSSKR
jgi:acetyl esterase/lipase